MRARSGFPELFREPLGTPVGAADIDERRIVDEVRWEQLVGGAQSSEVFPRIGRADVQDVAARQPELLSHARNLVGRPRREDRIRT